jgi:hypothetical protein
MLLLEERAICWADTFDKAPLNITNMTRPPALSIFNGARRLASNAEQERFEEPRGHALFWAILRRLLGKYRFVFFMQGKLIIVPVVDTSDAAATSYPAALAASTSVGKCS